MMYDLNFSSADIAAKEGVPKGSIYSIAIRYTQ